MGKSCQSIKPVLCATKKNKHENSISTTSHVILISLGPRPPPFLPSVCVHNNTRERKTGEKRGRPGSIHHVSGHGGGLGTRLILTSLVPYYKFPFISGTTSHMLHLNKQSVFVGSNHSN